LTKFEFPFILIHNVYIGGYHEFEELIEAKLLDFVLNKCIF
jgi:hypothetical protein